MHLSMFLEVTDPRNNEADWSCFVSHRLSVINQHRDSDKSVSKESQNRYSKAAKDWGWREFVTLTSLFDTDLGFLVSDTVVLCAEVCPLLLWLLGPACLLPCAPAKLRSVLVQPSLHRQKCTIAAARCMEDAVHAHALWLLGEQPGVDVCWCVSSWAGVGMMSIISVV